MNSPTKSTACIDDLPPEMICELFKHLSPKDLAACSMVNKRWHSIYAAFKLHTVVVTDYPHSDPHYDIIMWYRSNRPIQETERCRLSMFRRLAAKPLLSNLKHLALSGSFAFDLNKLNRFQQLLHLEINIEWFGRKVHLNLARLKVLAFHGWNHICALTIDCPRLSELLYAGEAANLLDVKHPETVRRLETRMSDPTWLAPFKSIECLIIDRFYQWPVISQDTLLLLPELRELRYNGNIESVVHYEFGSEFGTIDRMRRTLNEFLDEAKKLRGSDFRFTFAGFELTKVDVEQIDFGVQIENGEERVSNEYVYMKNYHLIESGALHFIDDVNYSLLLSHVTGEFPRCFFQEFTGIEAVQVDVVKDPDHLLWFLKSLRSLKSLWLVKTGLSQEFYDQLPASARSLGRLEFLGDQKTEMQLNFDFIREFPRLSKLEITPAISLESLASLIRSSAKLVFPRFKVLQKENRWLWIQKEGGLTVWRIISNGGSRLFEAANPDEIVNYVERLRA